jgi:hypothetical protein
MPCSRNNSICPGGPGCAPVFSAIIFVAAAAPTAPAILL